MRRARQTRQLAHSKMNEELRKTEPTRRWNGVKHDSKVRHMITCTRHRLSDVVDSSNPTSGVGPIIGCEVPESAHLVVVHDTGVL